MHFSPVFYDYVTKILNKECILVFNKIDLVQIELVVSWKEYFQTKFPKLNIILFASQPKIRKSQMNDDDAGILTY